MVGDVKDWSWCHTERWRKSWQRLKRHGETTGKEDAMDGKVSADITLGWKEMSSVSVPQGSAAVNCTVRCEAQSCPTEINEQNISSPTLCSRCGHTETCLSSASQSLDPTVSMFIAYDYNKRLKTVVQVDKLWFLRLCCLYTLLIDLLAMSISFSLSILILSKHFLIY